MAESLPQVDRPQAEVLQKPFAGKVAAVTGGTRGIGLEFVKHLPGATVITCNRDASKPKRIATAEKEAMSAGVESYTNVTVDISTPEGREAYLRAVIGDDLENPRMVDILVLSAAGGLEKKKKTDGVKGAEVEGEEDDEAEDPELMERALEMNVRSQLALLELFLPYLNKGAAVVYPTSRWARRFGKVKQIPGYPTVAATKNLAQEAIEERIAELNASGDDRDIKVAVIDGSLIDGTEVYRMTGHYYPISFEKLRQKTTDGKFPTTVNMGEALQTILLSDFNSGDVISVGETEMEPLEEVELDRKGLRKLMLMYSNKKMYLDKLTAFADGRNGVAMYRVRPSDVEGHLHGKKHGKIKVERGVDMGEMGAQAIGALYKLGHIDIGNEGLGFLKKVEVLVKNFALPGNQLVMFPRINYESSKFVVGECDMYVGQTLVAHAKVSFTPVDKVEKAQRSVEQEARKREDLNHFDTLSPEALEETKSLTAAMTALAALPSLDI